MELGDFSDWSVAEADARVGTGRRWRAKEEVQKVTARLQNQEVVGMVQIGRPVLG